MNKLNRRSDLLYMVSGFVEALKALGVIVFLREYWGEYFALLSFNIDLISAFSGLLAPWSIVYLQLCKKSSDAYVNACSTLMPVATLIAGVYFVSSVFIVFDQVVGGHHGLLGFLFFRAISFVVVTFSILTFLVLMRNGRGGEVFYLQVMSLFLILAVYYVSSQQVLSLNLALVGLGLLVVELLVFFVAHRIARGLGEYLSEQVFFDISFIKALKSQRLILLPELGSVVVVVLSSLSVAIAVLLTPTFEYHIYRIPFAFMTASWIISSKSMLLVMSFLSEGSKGGVSSIRNVFRNTWYVPCVLYLFAYVWVGGSSQRDGSAMLDQIFIGLAYYPAMVICIALSAWLRVENNNSILLKANVLMMVCYFIPLVALVLLNLIAPLYALHIVGASYVIKVIVILLLSGANYHEYYRVFKK